MADASPAGSPPVEPVSLARIRALEAIGRSGWPAQEIDRVGGWIVGASGSGAYTRRANSVAAESASVADADHDLDARIDAVERWYAARGRPATFKLPDHTVPASLAQALSARGYREASETIVQSTPIDSALATEARATDPFARIEVIANRIDPAWWALSLEASAVAEDVRDDYRAIVERAIESSDAALFGSATLDGRIQSVALAVVADAVVSFAQVATVPAARGRGLAARVLRALLYAASDQGAEEALLSVEAENGAARALYTRLGFRERYRYRYAIHGSARR